jgi:hypothetical protein
MRSTHIFEAQGADGVQGAPISPPVMATHESACAGSTSTLGRSAQESPSSQSALRPQASRQSPSKQRALAHWDDALHVAPSGDAPSADPMALGSTQARAPLGDGQQMRPAGHCASSQHALAQRLPVPPVNARRGTHEPSSH